MRRIAFAFLFCIIACGASAQEEQPRIPDLSLPLDESLHLPDTSNDNPNGFPTYPGQGGNGFGAINNGGGGLTGDGSNVVTRANRFMDAYCDPNFKPLIGDNPKVAGMQSCLAQQKQQQCATFHNLPGDVQDVLDDSIDCLYNAGDSDNPDANASDCKSNDSRRLRLMRKYAQDQTVAQAITSLPEDIMNTSSTCMREGR